MKTLREARIGEHVRIVRLHGEGAVKRRIMDMGLTRGTEVSVRKVAPLGDPLEITVRGYVSAEGGCGNDRGGIKKEAGEGPHYFGQIISIC